MEDICEDCEKVVDDTCSVYSPEGMAYRNRMGYCPIAERYADWREDKPKVKIQRIRTGQQKQKNKGDQNENQMRMWKQRFQKNSEVDIEWH